MKQQVLKALANPARIFYVPYSLAVMNFALLFLIFVVLFVISLIFTKGMDPISPMWFLVALIITHTMLAAVSKREPQLANIISAKFRLLKEKIPRRLVS